jgi:hypothetical protein
MYASAINWATMITLGIGGNEFMAGQFSTSETVVLTFVMIIGAVMWTWILSQFCDLAANSDPQEIQFKQQLDELNQFMVVNCLPNDQRARLREYVFHTRHLQVTRADATVLERLSPSLQTEVTMTCYRSIINALWFLKGGEDMCLVQLVMHLRPSVYSPQEVLDHGVIYIAVRGIVLYGIRVLGAGKMWGEETVLLNNPELWPMYRARTMSFLECNILHKVRDEHRCSCPVACVKRRSLGLCPLAG